jgi:ParB family chromosome partitioning protein
VDAAQALELALIENVVREDLTAIEEARTIATLLNDLKVTGSALAKRLGRSRTDLAHTVRLLELPDEVIGLVDRGTLSKGHGKALLTEPDQQRRRALGRLAAKQGWSVRRLEAEMATARNPRGASPEAHPDQLATAADLEEGIARATGREAHARPHRDGYQITIDQAGAEALARVLADRRGAS